MKIEIEIKTDDIVDQVARHMMGYVVQENGDVSYDLEEDYDPGTTAPKWKGKTVAELVKNIVAERTRRAVDAAVTEVTHARIREAVDQMLAEGWTKTNEWGETKGPRMDLKARIAEVLKESVESRHSYNHKGPRIDMIIKDAVKDAFDKEFAKEIEDAKSKLRTQVDAIVQAKLGEGLKTALGLK